MLWKLIAIAAAVVAAGAIGAVVFALLSDTQTASGSVNVTTTSPDLYLCEPNPSDDYACGPDDSGADETVFEGQEDIAPGQRAYYDVRLKNIGTSPITVTNVRYTATETSDPGNDCPDDSLMPATDYNGSASPNNTGSPAGAFRLVDAANDDTSPGGGNIPTLFRWNAYDPRAVYIAPGQAEDIRLAVQLNGTSTEHCDGNVWNVSWQFDVG